MPYPANNLLTIQSLNGSPVNEYRINHGQIEFRALDDHGKPFPFSNGMWRILDAADLEMHFLLNTAVAKWLVERLGVQPGAGWNKTGGPLDPT